MLIKFENIPIFSEIREQFGKIFDCVQGNLRLFIIFTIEQIIVVLLERMTPTFNKMDGTIFFADDVNHKTQN